jgi:hypothetical protein
VIGSWHAVRQTPAAIALGICLIAGGALLAGPVAPTAAATTPDGAVAELLDALAAGGRPDLTSVLCAERQELAGALDPLALLGPLPDGADPAPWLATRTLTVADRSIRVVEADESDALVAVSAHLEAGGDAGALAALVEAALVASGQPADDAAVAAAVERLPALVVGSRTIAGTVAIRAKGGTWRVCGDLLAADDGRAAICDRLTPEDAARLLPGDGGVATPGPGSCAWSVPAADGGPGTWVEARLLPGASLEPIVADWERGTAWTAAGRDGWVADGAAWLSLAGGRLLAVVAVTGDGGDGQALATGIASAIAGSIGADTGG